MLPSTIATTDYPTFGSLHPSGPGRRYARALYSPEYSGPEVALRCAGRAWSTNSQEALVGTRGIHATRAMTYLGARGLRWETPRYVTLYTGERRRAYGHRSTTLTSGLAHERSGTLNPLANLRKPATERLAGSSDNPVQCPTLATVSMAAFRGNLNDHP